MAKNNKDRNLLRNPIGGMFGGISEALLFHPLDTIKTKIQLSHKQLTTLDAIYKIKYVRNFYSGLFPVTMNLSLKYILRFQTNFALRRLMADENGHTTNLQNFSSGLLTGITEAICIVTPFDVIKTKLQNDKIKYPTFSSSFKSILYEDGVFGFWRGSIPTIIRQGSNQACMFTSYTLLRNYLYDPHDHINPLSAFIMGLFSSSIGPLCNGPMDVVKTRLMIQSKNNEIYKGSILNTTKLIYKYEGIGALYKGLFPRLLRLCPGQAIVWVVLEQFNKYCDMNNILM